MNLLVEELSQMEVEVAITTTLLVEVVPTGGLMLMEFGREMVS